MESSVITTVDPHGTVTVSVKSNGENSHPRFLASAPLVRPLAAPRPRALHDTSNETSWGLLYQGLVQGLNIDPAHFQLVYPMISWDWPVTNPGFISAAQYSFCTDIPEWSAVGQYYQSGIKFDQSYKAFLNAIAAATSDPNLDFQIQQAQNQLIQASGQLQTANQQAQLQWQKDCPDKTPSFMEWLGTPAGYGYGSQIKSYMSNVDKCFNIVKSLKDQTTTPGLKDAMDKLANTSNLSQLQDPTLNTFPVVPGYSLSQDSVSWTTKARAGQGVAGTISFNNSQSAFDYKKTWAGGSASVGNWFWSVNASGSWERITQFESSSKVEVSISFKAWEIININSGPWYDSSFPSSHRNGPFIKGYTGKADPANPSNVNFWGEGGLLNLQKVGFLVVFQPTITITTDQSTFNSFHEKWEAAGGIRIGPFQLGGGGGSTHDSWNKSASGTSFTATSTSTVPQIVGVYVSAMP